MTAVLYAAGGSALTIWLGRPLMRLNYRQSDREADYRSELIRTRENADGIALAGKERTSAPGSWGALTESWETSGASFR
jgi:putative ATP-binding cassette transporter